MFTVMEDVSWEKTQPIPKLAAKRKIETDFFFKKYHKFLSQLIFKTLSSQRLVPVITAFSE